MTMKQLLVLSLRKQIRWCDEARDETIGDAGRYWQECEFTRHSLALIAKEKAELEQRLKGLED